MSTNKKSSNNALAMTLLKGRTFIVLIVLLIFFSIKAANFLSLNTAMLIAKHVALYGILGIGMTYVIITGGIDLSVGANPKKDRNIDWEKQETVLEVRDLTLPKSGGGYLLHHVDFNLKRGEILGIYGLMGAGRTEVFECIMGLRPEHTGDILLEGKKMEIHSISEQIERGFALVPEDRQREGLVQTMSILKNISLSSIKKYVKGFLLDDKLEGRRADEQIKDIHIKVADKNLPILSLSGGNQQKVVIGKGLLTNPKILLLDEPSRGIDIGAKTEVFDIINQYAEKGLSIIVISSELKEIIAIADRVMVLSNGIKTGELIGDEIQEESLVLSSYKGHHGQ